MRIRRLWRNLVQRRRVEEDLAEELRSYQDMLEDSGLSRREAMMEMGGAAQIQEQVRDIRVGAQLGTMSAELRQAIRGLGRNPSLTLVATLMLAMGIGASTLVFSIVHAALLQPMPFGDPDRLVGVYETRLDRGWDRASFTDANFWDLRQQNRSFEDIASARFGKCTFSTGGDPEKVNCGSVTHRFFHVLRAQPVLGRDFNEDEGNGSQAQRVTILSDRFWRSKFAADPQVIGRAIQLDELPYTIIGVLPPGRRWINEDTYTIWHHRANANRGSFEFSVVGRLKPDATAKSVAADLQSVAANLARAFPMEAKGIGFGTEPSSSWGANPTTRRALWALLGAVTFLLLIACVNIANLLLARGMSRKREIAVRTALGASRGRLIRFVMMEALVLSICGGVLGVGLAFGGLRAIQVLQIRDLPQLADASLNPWVLGFSVTAAILTGLLAGIAPALQAPASGIAISLREGDRQTGSHGQRRLRASLVTLEVAMSFLLLVGAGLLIRSFNRILAVDRGFQTENRLVFTVSLPDRYEENDRAVHFVEDLFTRIRALPQVRAAGSVSHRPVEGSNPGMGIVAASQQQLTGSAVPWAGWRVVTSGYLRSVGLPLLRGRFIQDTDPDVWRRRGQPEPARHVVISNRLAKLLLPNVDPIGQHVILWKGQGGMEAEVVGVVGDSRERGLVNDPTLTVYLPAGSNFVPQEFVVHTTGAPLAVMPSIRAIIASMDRNLPISDVRSFDAIVNRSLSPQRFNTLMLAIFSGLALVLATTGIYGVLSYSMSRRTSEIGLRVALGASGRSILGMALAQGMLPVAIGLAIGAAASWWLTRYLTTLLYEVKPFDLTTYLCVAGLLVLTASIACLVPGWRASRIDPGLALRVE